METLLLVCFLILTCGGAVKGLNSNVAWLVPQAGGQVTAPAGATVFNTLESFLEPQHLAFFDTITLTCDYSLSAAAWGHKQLQLERNLTIQSASGYVFILSFDFIKKGVVVPEGVTVHLRNLAMAKIRKDAGWSLPFFSGNGGIMWLENVVRMRLVCLPVAGATTVNNLQSIPRPAGFPGKQNVSIVSYYFRGAVYANSTHDTDLVMFLGPGDVDDSATYTGYVMVQYNVTRICLNWVDPSCTGQPDVCLAQAVEQVLAVMEGRASGDRSMKVIAIVVPIAAVVVLAGTISILLILSRRKKQSPHQLQTDQQFKGQQSKQQQDQQPKHAQHNTGQPLGGRNLVASCNADTGDLAAAGFVNVCSGVPGLSDGCAAGAAGHRSGNNSSWQLMACHTAPEFRESTHKDKITLGVLLGVGSFGRVYKGVWHGMTVAVKVLHHDASTAAAVANEVDLIMSFRHPNITTAYHFITWRYDGTDAVAEQTKAPVSTPSAPPPAGVELPGSGNRMASEPSAHKVSVEEPCDPKRRYVQRSHGEDAMAQTPAHGMPAVRSSGLPGCDAAGAPCKNLQDGAIDGVDSVTVEISANGHATGLHEQRVKLPPLILQQLQQERQQCPPLAVTSQQLVSQQQQLDVRETAAQQQQQFIPLRPQLLLEQQHDSSMNASLEPSVQQQQLLPVAPLQRQQLQESDRAQQVVAQQQPQQSSNSRQLQQPAILLDPVVNGNSGGAGSSSRAKLSSSQGRGEAQTWLLMEFCDGGTLLDVVQDGRLVSETTGRVNMAHVLTLLCDVAAGMSYLHSRNVLHGDLKPGNVLLKQQQGAPFGHICKVTDFGMSRSLNAGQSHLSTRTMGTVNHTSPESLRLGRLSPAGDVFSFAIMMWELYTGRVAWAGQHYGEVFERVALLQERPPVPPDMPADYLELMTAAWAADPFTRPTFDVIRKKLAEMLRGIVQDAAEAKERFISDL